MDVVRVYGLTEIARRLGIPVGTVRQWYHRGKLPEPSGVLAMGPLWLEDRIGPWFALKAAEGFPKPRTPARSSKRLRGAPRG